MYIEPLCFRLKYFAVILLLFFFTERLKLNISSCRFSEILILGKNYFMMVIYSSRLISNSCNTLYCKLFNCFIL